MGDFSFLINSVQNITGPMVVMWLIGGLLIWLAIKKDYEPALLLPMGFGAILVNLPDTGVLGDNGIIQWLYNVGIGASEAFPLLLFVGIGAMIDFGPLLSNPKMLLFGGAAQFGIFMTVVLAVLLGFPLRDAMSAGVIGAAALMRPSKSCQDMEVSSLKKKFKDKKFAAGCSRDVIKTGAERLGWTLEELMEKTLQAQRSCEESVAAQMAAL